MSDQRPGDRDDPSPDQGPGAQVGVRIGDGLAAVVPGGADDLHAAARRAVAAALVPLGGVQPDLAMVWVSGADPDLAGRVLAHASAALGAVTTVGCSAHGVLGSGLAVEAEPAVAVWAAVLPGAQVRAFHLETLRTEDAITVVGMPDRRPDDAVVVLLADPYSFPAAGFVGDASGGLVGLPIIGGLASGALAAGDSRLLLDSRVVDRGAVGLVMGGAIHVHPLVSQGCRPVGPPMTVTSADGNVIETLAGRRALDQAREVVSGLPASEQTLALSGLHLGVAMDEYADDHSRGDFLVRGILGADEAMGAIAVGDTVPLGRTVRFHLRDAAGAELDLDGVLGSFRRATSAPLAGALLFTSNGRGRAMFAAPDHDVLAVRTGLGVPGVGGFFTAGEFGPVGGRNHLHGFTATVLAFEEAVDVPAGQHGRSEPVGHTG